MCFVFGHRLARRPKTSRHFSIRDLDRDACLLWMSLSPPLLINTPRLRLLTHNMFGFLPKLGLPSRFSLGFKRMPLGPLWPFAFMEMVTPQATSDLEETAARVTFGRETRERFQGTGRGLRRAESADSPCQVLNRPPRRMERREQPQGQPDASHKPPAFSGFSSDHLEQLHQARSRALQERKRQVYTPAWLRPCGFSF